MNKEYIMQLEKRLLTLQQAQQHDLNTQKQLDVNIPSRNGAILELQNAIKIYQDFDKIKEPIKVGPEKPDKPKQLKKKSDE